MFYLNALNRYRVNSSFLLLALILVSAQISLAANVNSKPNSFGSTISGFVYDQNRNPVSQVDVELVNANIGGSRSLRDRTDPNGRYEFNGLADGRYTVNVLAFRLNLNDKSEEVIVHTVSILGGGGSGYFSKDIYLTAKKGGLGDTTTGVIFAQEVPKEAEELYKEADDALSSDKVSEGMNKLKEAIKIFPTYYAASQRLGIELLKTKQYLDATQLFMRAAEANPKSSRSFYYMGFALNNLTTPEKNFNKAALKALEKAAVLASASWEVFYLIGKIEREEGNFVEAEKQLLKSKKLATTKIPEIHKELAQLYGNDLKKYDKAADELELYLKSSKKNDEGIKKQIADLRIKAKKNG